MQKASDPDGDPLTLTAVSAPSPVGTSRIDGPVAGFSNCEQSVYYEWPEGWSGVATMTWSSSGRDSETGIA